jgi:hypothetical protein
VKSFWGIGGGDNIWLGQGIEVVNNSSPTLPRENPPNSCRPLSTALFPLGDR